VIEWFWWAPGIYPGQAKTKMNDLEFIPNIAENKKQGVEVVLMACKMV